MCTYCDKFNAEKQKMQAKEKIAKAVFDSLDLPATARNIDYEPFAMRRVGEAGRRLLQNPKDNFAVAEAMRTILNQMNLAELHGDTYYEKFFPLDANGKRKKVSFKSPFFCQTEREEMTLLYWTEDSASVVRGGIQSCGKAWTCPVCGAKIAVRRNEEVKIILKKAHKMKKAST